MRLSTLPEGVHRRVGEGSGERGGRDGGGEGEVATAFEPTTRRCQYSRSTL